MVNLIFADNQQLVARSGAHGRVDTVARRFFPRITRKNSPYSEAARLWEYEIKDLVAERRSSFLRARFFRRRGANFASVKRR